MAKVLIRPATADDQEVVLDLLEELFAPPGSRPSGYDRARAATNFRRYVESDVGDVLLAETDGTIVGLASVNVDLESMRFGTRCWLEDLVVTSTRRSSGVGAALLDAAAAWGRARGCTHLKLESGNARKDAHRFYLAKGMDQQSLSFQITL